MDFALANAIGEITLVIFTTLAPAAVVACVIAAVPSLATDIDYDVRYSLNKAFALPLVIASAGLVASATHLGNPSNALYVFNGMGRSPLSNEVIAAVVFLVCAGTYWLFSFSEKPHFKLRRAWVAVGLVTGLIFIATVSLAYNVQTIITWRQPAVPVSVWLNALLAGPMLGMLTLQLSKWRPSSSREGKIMLGVSTVALVGNIICYIALGMSVMGLQNSMVAVADIVPFYWIGLAACTVLAAAGVALMWTTTREADKGSLSRTICACVLVFAAIFIMRFMFYMMHITAGVGL